MGRREGGEREVGREGGRKGEGEGGWGVRRSEREGDLIKRGGK